MIVGSLVAYVRARGVTHTPMPPMHAGGLVSYAEGARTTRAGYQRQGRPAPELGYVACVRRPSSGAAALGAMLCDGPLFRRDGELLCCAHWTFQIQATMKYDQRHASKLVLPRIDELCDRIVAERDEGHYACAYVADTRALRAMLRQATLALTEVQERCNALVRENRRLRGVPEDDL